MDKQSLILSLKHRIEHNEERLADHERRHGEYVARNPRMICSVESEMADWHKGKINAYNAILEMLLPQPDGDI